jgi:hypothetical protein
MRPIWSTLHVMGEIIALASILGLIAVLDIIFN